MLAAKSESSLDAILQACAASLSRMRRRIEAHTIIPLIEGVSRFWYHLDPRVYFQGRRIKAVTQGNRDRKSSSFAILALYLNGPLPDFTANVIAAIDASPPE